MLTTGEIEFLSELDNGTPLEFYINGVQLPVIRRFVRVDSINGVLVVEGPRDENIKPEVLYALSGIYYIKEVDERYLREQIWVGRRVIVRKSGAECPGEITGAENTRYYEETIVRVKFQTPRNKVMTRRFALRDVVLD